MHFISISQPFFHLQSICFNCLLFLCQFPCFISLYCFFSNLYGLNCLTSFHFQLTACFSTLPTFELLYIRFISFPFFISTFSASSLSSIPTLHLYPSCSAIQYIFSCSLKPSIQYFVVSFICNFSISLSLYIIPFSLHLLASFIS